ncbi:extracellular solute-binding protein [Acinetobacter sp. CUI P1]|nr:extracellular solute-binding protein [Acinetobacter sp. CUI P1]
MKKKQSFKTIASLTLTATIVASLTACGGGNDNDSSSNSQAPGSAATNAASSSDNNQFGFSPAIDVKVGFAFPSNFTFEGQETEAKNTWMDLYAEKGMTISPMYSVDANQADTKLSTAIASGRYPDIFSVKGSDLVKYAHTNVIADLTEAYEKYATPELKAYLDTDKGASLSSAKVDGKLYAIPKITSGYDSVMMMFVRQDWLDNLGLQMPTTMDELVEVARAFTKNDPDKNGKPDTYGMALNGMEGFAMVSGIQAFFEGYGAAPGHWNGNFTFIEKDGQVIWGGDLPTEMKKGLTALQTMYKEGSLAQNFGTMDLTAINKDLGSGKAGIFFAPMWGPMAPSMDAVKNDVNAHFTSAPIPDGNGAGSSKAYMPTLPESYYVSSSQTENPEVVIKMANLSVQKLIHPQDDEEFNKYYGKVGTYSGWKFSFTQTLNPLKNLDNYYKLSAALQSGDISPLNLEQKTNYDKMKAYLDAVKDGSFAEKVKAQDSLVLAGMSHYSVFGDPLGGEASVDKIKTTNAVNPAAYNYVPTETMSSKYTTLNKMALETIVKIIYGENVDSYDKFLKSWKALGGDAVTKEAQDWFNGNK